MEQPGKDKVPPTAMPLFIHILTGFHNGFLTPMAESEGCGAEDHAYRHLGLSSQRLGCRVDPRITAANFKTYIRSRNQDWAAQA